MSSPRPIDDKVKTKVIIKTLGKLGPYIFIEKTFPLNTWYLKIHKFKIQIPPIKLES